MLHPLPSNPPHMSTDINPGPRTVLLRHDPRGRSAVKHYGQRPVVGPPTLEDPRRAADHRVVHSEPVEGVFAFLSSAHGRRL